MKQRSKAIAFTGLCTALALVLAYVEVLLPPLFPALPGVKMGLPNIILIFLLYRAGAKTAMLVSLMRIVLVTVLFGNWMAFLYSLAGGVLSLVLMILLRRWDVLSTIGVSIVGGVTHNVGQILMAILLLNTVQIGYYLVVLTVTGALAGVLIGVCGSLLIKKIPDKLLFF